MLEMPQRKGLCFPVLEEEGSKAHWMQETRKAFSNHDVPFIVIN